MTVWQWWQAMIADDADDAVMAIVMVTQSWITVAEVDANYLASLKHLTSIANEFVYTAEVRLKLMKFARQIRYLNETG